MEFFIGAFVIRFINAALWTAVVLRVRHDDRPVSGTSRKLITVVIFLGFWMLAVGGMAPFLPIGGEWLRLVYTAYTAFSAIIAAALLMEERI